MNDKGITEMTRVIVRPWHTEEDKAKLIEWATKQAKGNEITLIEICQNIYKEDFVRVVFKTVSEGQKRYGYFTLHERKKLLYLLPKKYQPQWI